MTTLQQIEANRLNSRKSTGPLYRGQSRGLHERVWQCAYKEIERLRPQPATPAQAAGAPTPHRNPLHPNHRTLELALFRNLSCRPSLKPPAAHLATPPPSP